MTSRRALAPLLALPIVLAAWAWGKRSGGSDQAAQDYVRKLFAQVPVLDSGARGAGGEL